MRLGAWPAGRRRHCALRARSHSKGHAGEVLQYDARHHEGNFLAALRGRLPMASCATCSGGDALCRPCVAQHRFRTIRIDTGRRATCGKLSPTQAGCSSDMACHPAGSKHGCNREIGHDSPYCRKCNYIDQRRAEVSRHAFPPRHCRVVRSGAPSGGSRARRRLVEVAWRCYVAIGANRPILTAAWKAQQSATGIGTKQVCEYLILTQGQSRPVVTWPGFYCAIRTTRRGNMYHI